MSEGNGVPPTADFTDTAGRVWHLEIHPHAMKQVRERTHVVIGTLLDDGLKGLAELFGDPCLLADVLYVLVADEAEKRQVTPEQFGRSLGGGVMESAADAFVVAMANFSPGRRRATLLAVAEKNRALMARLGEVAEAELDAINLEDVIATWKNSAGISPGSSGSMAPG